MDRMPDTRVQLAYAAHLRVHLTRYAFHVQSTRSVQL